MVEIFSLTAMRKSVEA